MIWRSIVSAWVKMLKWLDEVVSLSTTEANFVGATTTTVNQAIWLGNILAYLDQKQEHSTYFYWQLNSYFNLIKSKTEHFNLKVFYLRKVQKNGYEILVYQVFSPYHVWTLRKKFAIWILQSREKWDVSLDTAFFRSNKSRHTIYYFFVSRQVFYFSTY